MQALKPPRTTVLARAYFKTVVLQVLREFAAQMFNENSWKNAAVRRSCIRAIRPVPYARTVSYQAKKESERGCK